MSTCCVCGRKYPSDAVEDICECGGGLVQTGDENLLSWVNEYDSDGF